MSNGLYAAIAQGGAPIQIQDPLNQMARVMAIKNAQQEGQLNALRMAEAQAGAEETGKLRNVLSQYKDLYSPEAQAAIMGTGLKGLEYAKGLSAAQKGGLEVKELQGKITKQQEDRSRARLTDLFNNPSDENIIAHLQDDLNAGLITRDKAMQQLTRYSAMTPDQRKQEFQTLSLGLARYTELNKPTLTSQGFGGGERLLATPGLGGPATEVVGSRIARTISPDTAARLAQERDIGLQSRISEAKEYGQTLGKSRATAEAALPGAVATAEQTINLIDQMIGKPTIKDANGKVIQRGTAPHPGFSSYVGATLTPGARFVEGSSTADFERYQLQVEGKAFLEAFEALKGGGAITEIEGAKGTQAIMRMNKAQSEKEYMKAARELQDIVRKGVEKARAKAGVEAPAAPAAGPAAPAAAPMAPMYARNPQTGQRIMSTDGGATWNPAR